MNTSTKSNVVVVDDIALFEKLAKFKGTEYASEVENEIIAKYFNLVNDIAHKRANQTQISNREELFDNYQSVGLEGLLSAIRKFDYTKGIKFTTFAYSQIESVILKYMAENTNTHFTMSASTGNLLQSITIVKNQLYTELDREPTTKEIRIAMNNACSERQIKSLLEQKYCSVTSLDEVNTTNKDGDEADLHDVVADESANIQEEVSKNYVFDIMWKYIEEHGDAIDKKSIELYIDGYTDAAIAQKLFEDGLTTKKLSSEAIRKRRKAITDAVGRMVR